jgi:hypothetical protein
MGHVHRCTGSAGVTAPGSQAPRHKLQCPAPIHKYRVGRFVHQQVLTRARASRAGQRHAPDGGAVHVLCCAVLCCPYGCSGRKTLTIACSTSCHCIESPPQKQVPCYAGAGGAGCQRCSYAQLLLLLLRLLLPQSVYGGSSGSGNRAAAAAAAAAAGAARAARAAAAGQWRQQQPQMYSLLLFEGSMPHSCCRCRSPLASTAAQQRHGSAPPVQRTFQCALARPGPQQIAPPCPTAVLVMLP